MIVVGIGASAGGLEALLPFVSHLPSDTGMCFVIVQHGSAKQPSLLVDLLRKSSKLAVIEACDGAQLRANTIFVAPYDADVSLEKEFIRLNDTEQQRVPRFSIDFFFTSLAASYFDFVMLFVLKVTHLLILDSFVFLAG
ncbi:MAG: hypothetical protein Kow0065_08580 [Methylomicrobium sp.]